MTMNGKPAVRQQHDGMQDAYSDEAAIDCTTKPDLARQEFKTESDVNNILNRFGVPIANGTFGTEVDYTIDLQHALGAITDARRAHRNLPENLREKYPTWQSLLNALESGSLEMKNEDEPPADAADKTRLDIIERAKRKRDLEDWQRMRELERLGIKSEPKPANN